MIIHTVADTPCNCSCFSAFHCCVLEDTNSTLDLRMRVVEKVLLYERRNPDKMKSHRRLAAHNMFLSRIFLLLQPSGRVTR